MTDNDLALEDVLSSAVARNSNDAAYAEEIIRARKLIARLFEDLEKDLVGGEVEKDKAIGNLTKLSQILIRLVQMEKSMKAVQEEGVEWDDEQISQEDEAILARYVERYSRGGGEKEGA